jgi:hypothetical protein
VVGGEPRVDVEEYEEDEVVEVCEGTFVGVAADIVKKPVCVVWRCGGGDGGSGWFVRVLFEASRIGDRLYEVSAGDEDA